VTDPPGLPASNTSGRCGRSQSAPPPARWPQRVVLMASMSSWRRRLRQGSAPSRSHSRRLFPAARVAAAAPAAPTRHRPSQGDLGHKATWATSPGSTERLRIRVWTRQAGKGGLAQGLQRTESQPISALPNEV